MDNPQYTKAVSKAQVDMFSFKPYYKWITLNTVDRVEYRLVNDVEF